LVMQQYKKSGQGCAQPLLERNGISSIHYLN
jgi:hypothetical protein